MEQGEDVVVISYELVPRRPPCLTASEYRVTEMIMGGLSNADIADARATSPYTVANQVAAIFNKLGVNSRAELVVKLHRACRCCAAEACGSCPHPVA